MHNACLAFEFVHLELSGSSRVRSIRIADQWWRRWFLRFDHFVFCVHYYTLRCRANNSSAGGNELQGLEFDCSQRKKFYSRPREHHLAPRKTEQQIGHEQQDHQQPRSVIGTDATYRLRNRSKSRAILSSEHRGSVKNHVSRLWFMETVFNLGSWSRWVLYSRDHANNTITKNNPGDFD